MLYNTMHITKCLVISVQIPSVSSYYPIWLYYDFTRTPIEVILEWATLCSVTSLQEFARKWPKILWKFIYGTSKNQSPVEQNTFHSVEKCRLKCFLKPRRLTRLNRYFNRSRIQNNCIFSKKYCYKKILPCIKVHGHIKHKKLIQKYTFKK